MAPIALKLFPTVESLSNATHTFTCPSTTCRKVVMSAPALHRHLKSCLRLQFPFPMSEAKQFVMEFHCPIAGCNYDKDSVRSFSCLKYLKQHYDKVHAEKKFQCETCNQSFSRSFHLAAHSRDCGRNFVCSCGITYTSRMALLTHAKRKKHTFREMKPEDKEVVPMNKSTTSTVSQEIQPIVGKISFHVVEDKSINEDVKPRFLLPKPVLLKTFTTSNETFRLSVPRKIDVGIQTQLKNADICGQSCKNLQDPKLAELLKTLKRNLSKGSANDLMAIVGGQSRKRIRKSAETQTKTGVLRRNTKRQKTSAQTQTSHMFRKNTEETRPCRRVSKSKNVARQSIHTQTSALTSECKSSETETTTTCTTCFNPKTFSRRKRSSNGERKHLETAAAFQLEQISSGTQTRLEMSNHQLCTSSSQTEKDVFLGHMSDDFGDAHFLAIDRSTSVMSSDCTTDFGYEDMFSSGSCSCDRIRVYSSETQTELNLDYLFMCDDDGGNAHFDDNILCSNIQTQTTDDSDFLPYEVLLSNMQTQTSQNHSELLPELTFSDIETQTVCMRTLLVDVPEHELVHIETQTSTLPQSIHTQT